MNTALRECKQEIIGNIQEPILCVNDYLFLVLFLGTNHLIGDSNHSEPQLLVQVDVCNKDLIT